MSSGILDAREPPRGTGRGSRRRSGDDPRADAPPFVLFVEGPRDRHILQGWAHRVSPLLARRLVESTVILGGRQPARAVRHLRERAENGQGARGLCVLDRDADGPDPAIAPEGVDLDVFTWGRRHIEAYLLVPDAIRRALRLRDRGLERLLRDELPRPDDERALARVDAKRLLGHRGALHRLLGSPVDPGRIARAMREDEQPLEVRQLLGQIGERVGLAPRQVIVRGGAGR